MQRAELLNKVIQSGVVSVVRAESGEKALKIVEGNFTRFQRIFSTNNF